MLSKYINIILSFINILLFLRLIWGINFTSYPVGLKNYSFDAISTQIAIMDVILTCMSIGLAVAGFVGYNSIKISVEEK